MPAPSKFSAGRILIVGGYGHVGRSIAVRLAPRFPGRVVVAGRCLAKAEAEAGVVGNGATGRAIDLSDGGAAYALEGVSVALVCVDQSETRFVEQCLSRGVHYVDLSADDDFLSRVEKLDRVARDHHATALLSVGVAPGLTNLLAVRAQRGLASVDRVDLLLELGLGDTHGKAALEWLFDNLDAEYQVRVDGRLKRVRSFAESTAIRLPGERTARAAHRFNFSDQHVLGRTFDTADVSTWVRSEDRLSTWLFARGVSLGLGRLLRGRSGRRAALWLSHRLRFGSDRCLVATYVTGLDHEGSTKSTTLMVADRQEARMTAVVAAEMTRQVISGMLPSGVWHSHQVIDLDTVLEALRGESADLVTCL